MNDGCININGPIYINTVKNLTDNDLYHYTSADTFFKIMESYALKTSSFNNLNDLNEAKFSEIGNLSTDFLKRNEIDDFVRKNCKLLCFSQNYKKDGVALKSTGILCKR